MTHGKPAALAAHRRGPVGPPLDVRPHAAVPLADLQPHVELVPDTLLIAALPLEPVVETVGEGVATPPPPPPPAPELAPRPQLGVTLHAEVVGIRSMDTNEDSLAKDMQRKGRHNLDNQGITSSPKFF